MMFMKMMRIGGTEMGEAKLTLQRLEDCLAILKRMGVEGIAEEDDQKLEEAFRLLKSVYVELLGKIEGGKKC